MTATAAKTANNTATDYANQVGYGLAPSMKLGGNRVTASAVRSLDKPVLEPLQPECRSRRGRYLNARGKLRPGEITVIARMDIKGATYLAPETPPPQPQALTAKQIARQAAFTKHMQHIKYLKRVSTGERALITPETAFRALHAWRLIWVTSQGSVPVPAACTGPDGEMFYSWDRGQHHLELEIIPGQPAEFFYRDRETEQFWGEDYVIGDPLPAELVSKLHFFR